MSPLVRFWARLNGVDFFVHHRAAIAAGLGVIDAQRRSFEATRLAQSGVPL